MNTELITQLTQAVETASKQWRDAFNAGDPEACAALYEESAIMNAKPLGCYEGRKAIHSFWRDLMSKGYSEVEYFDQRITVIDADTVYLRARWKMNQAWGVIHLENWAIQADGSAKLREDIFEDQG